MPALYVAPHPLSPDLVPWIFEVFASLFLVRVVAVDAVSPTPPGTEQGVLQLQVVEVFRGEPLAAGAPITIVFSRAADEEERDRLGFDQWNALDIDQGAWLLLAATHVSRGQYDALAAQNVASPEAPDVAELRAAVELHERDKPADEVEALYRNAVIGGATLLRRYALEAIGNRGIGSRLAGVAALRAAVDADSLSPDEKLDVAAYALGPAVFDEERHADRANREVVALFVRGYLQDPDPANRVTWTKYLGSVLARSFAADAAEDRAVKESLVRAVERPDWESMRELLARQAQVGPADERELTADVLAAWLLAL